MLQPLWPKNNAEKQKDTWDQHNIACHACPDVSMKQMIGGPGISASEAIQAGIIMKCTRWVPRRYSRIMKIQNAQHTTAYPKYSANDKEFAQCNFILQKDVPPHLLRLYKHPRWTKLLRQLPMCSNYIR